MIIDSHHHFWKYNETDYGWIGEDMHRLKMDFLPSDLEIEAKNTGVNGFITVQARQSLRETECLLELANQHEIIKGIVGWLPLTDDKLDEYLHKYSSGTYLKGLRHVLHDEADEEYMLRNDFNRGIAKLKSYKLSYDILIFEKHLPQTILFVDKHPEQVFILNHIAKPLIRNNILSPWKENIKELARRENVFCKISGMTTEAGVSNWSWEQLKPYLDVVLEAFGSDRILYGSDWPVCLLGCTYKDWFQGIQTILAPLSETEKMNIMGLNALKAYRIQN
ncbi:MAG: amidohydrolase family protein [Bacteroidales bacterium]|nr:amidohydrolase family protein [Bacteroidales bacterium]